MDKDLLVLQERINGVIYNPFINLKDHLKEVRKLIATNDAFKAELAKLDAALLALDACENLPYGNLERIKGFNKTKSAMQKLVKDLIAKL